MDLIKEIKQSFDWIETIFEEGGLIIIEESYDAAEDEKNSDDCCDIARENGEMIIERFPELEIVQYYCHRHKYAIVDLKIK